MSVDSSLIVKDYTRDSLLTPFSIATLKDRYLTEDETSPQDAFARAAAAFADDLNHAQRLYDYASKLWFMFATPILANGGTSRGLPISCVLNYVPDSRNGLTDHYTETAWLSSVGAGIGGYWGDIRSGGERTSKGSSSSGAIPFMKVVDAVVLAFKQASRRGSYAAYMDVSHPEIEEFIAIRKPTGGDENRKCLNLHNAVNVTDDFMRAVEENGPWNLVDPHSKRVTKTIKARDLWRSILETRVQTGEPYVNFIDTVNKALPESQKAKGLKVRQSNLCLAGDTTIHVKSVNDNTFEGTIKIADVGVYIEKYGDLKVLTTRPRTVARDGDVAQTPLLYRKITDFRMTARDAELIEITDTRGDVLRCTPDHEVFAELRGFVRAKDLIVGESLACNVIKVSSVEYLKEREDVYDITVEDVHCFFASGNFLVHNCNEIHLPTDENRTAVCCLSSVNLDTFDEWRHDPIFIEDLVRMLDNVLTYFIDNAPPAAHKAVYSAMMERAIGLGAMGLHSYLQRHMTPFEGIYATGINNGIFSQIKKQAVEASKKLAAERGSPSDMLGTGLRFSHLLAIAPNASSSILCGGTSPSIEPIKANAFTHKTLSGSFLVKNRYLEKVLEAYGKNTNDVWTSIITNAGSVQHLDFLTDEERDVFKTAIEISQFWVVDHAAIRQKYICQGQSVNLFFPADVSAKELNQVHLAAWKRGLKGLYYCRSEAISRPETVSQKIERQLLAQGEVAIEGEDETCRMCEG